MPVYLVNAVSGTLTPDSKQRVAKAITKVHHELTGSQRFLVQVIFKEQPVGNLFLGGSLQDGHNIFVHGLNRAGRTPELKKNLTRKLADEIAEAASVSLRDVWVYIDERPASQMIEYGVFLPEPGEEKQWQESLSAEDRRFMESIVST